MTPYIKAMLAAIILSVTTAHAESVGDITTTEVICTKKGVQAIMRGAAKSEKLALAASSKAIGDGECLYQPPFGFEIKLLERMRVFTDYDGEVVSVWRVGPAEGKSDSLYTWFFGASPEVQPQSF